MRKLPTPALDEGTPLVPRQADALLQRLVRAARLRPAGGTGQALGQGSEQDPAGQHHGRPSATSRDGATHALPRPTA